MNTLTKNRILQKGDEYRDNGAWKPVPKTDFGLQIQFTTYKEVRRPSEKQISPEINATKSAEPSTAEKEKSPVPTPSGAGDTLPNPPPIETVVPCFPDRATQAAQAAESYLPTIVSKKAHSQKRDREIIDSIPYDLPMTDEERAALDREKDREVAAETAKAIEEAAAKHKTETEKAAEKAKLIGSANGHIKIDFPHAPINGNVPIWTGRNGTFNGYALEAMVVDDRIMLSPIGKRGVGNCAIQFPVSVIPQIIDWLAQQHREKPPK